ncbi:hypothetical protein LWC35_34650 [Pseudonocardia kujensis]|uniref:hypothetical protein n=1 Tax=Pseudonocardia kujensis TaxID=1128675 RepID=UPI001E61400C|nr:hypothetical protein [Pseudonocardia kujensis]MCE0768002.1 hypothetical protein [Pseudonocardia kujensis]
MSERVRARLRLLHDEYVAAVNFAVEEGREDLVERLAADYPDAALRVMAEYDEVPDAA